MNAFDYLPHLENFLSNSLFHQYLDHFKERILERASPQRHGDLPTWQSCLDRLPEIATSRALLDRPAITFETDNPIENDLQTELFEALFDLKPWRKGPYSVFGVDIDTEWRSDWKWDRVQPYIAPLNGKTVLDVGCGTGYHCWRMLGDGAHYVLGIDPSMRFVMQYNAIQKYAKNAQFDFLPIGIEDMPESIPIFDTVFSMGVLYHRRNPKNHILELKNLLAPNGQLVLETLIVDEAADGLFRPEGRYAQMRNVWSITTVPFTLGLLKEAGFSNARCVDQNVTSLEEQRQTDWMQFHSLKEFLSADDISKTVEGHPAPKRGIFIAELLD